MLTTNIAHILFYRTLNGHVNCKVNFGGRGISYLKNLSSKYKRNKGADKDQYPYIVTLDYLNAFLDSNRIDICIVDDKSIKRFYGFSNGMRMYTFINPSQKQVDEWHEHDAPNLYRFEIKTGETLSENVLKRILLAEWGHESTYVSEQMTKIEVFLFTKNHSNAVISKAMMEKVI